MSPQQIVNLLNDAFKHDPKAIAALFAVRMPCNEALADHPTITVAGMDAKGMNIPLSVGVLGLLNGIAAIENGLIQAIYSDENVPHLLGFKSVPYDSDLMNVT